MKPLACLTIARNEPHFLPVWLRHYGETGGDLVLLDHENDSQDLIAATDECVSNRFPLTIVPVSNPRSDDVHWMRYRVEGMVDELLTEYRTVVFAEVDELLVVDPRLGSDLGGFLRSLDHPSVHFSRWTATGMEVIPGDRWVRNDQYDKTLIVRERTRWEVGFHRPIECVRPEPDPSLVLVHLHYRSREVAWDRLVARQRGKEIVQDGLGFQNKFTSRAAFDAHFDEVCRRPSEPIPERFLTFLG